MGGNMFFTPWTKRIIIIVAGVVLIVSMFTGHFEQIFDLLLDLVSGDG